MIVLGLTGSIGMGKSTIGTMMKNMNIPVHESDHVVHQLLEMDSEARPAIACAFPFFEHPQIYDKKTKDIKRKELGELIFHNDEHRETLESIMHPLVQKSQTEFIRASKLKGLDMVCLDIPLLFETGADKRVDYTITVSAPEFIQRQRVLARPNMTEEKFKAITERQISCHEKCARADYVIKTGIGHAHSLKELKTILLDIQEKENPSEEREDEDDQDRLQR